MKYFSVPRFKSRSDCDWVILWVLSFAGFGLTLTVEAYESQFFALEVHLHCPVAGEAMKYIATQSMAVKATN